MKVFVYYAAEAPRAVIVVRYKSTKGFYKMFLWHTDTNKVEPGQWLTHKKIWPNLCRISKDGTLFQYFMAELNPWKTYTVMCEPPYFSAIKIKEEVGTWFCDGKVNWVDSPSEGVKGSDLLSASNHLATVGPKNSNKKVECRDDVLFVDGQPLIRFQDYSFENIAPPAIYPRLPMISYALR